jgi:hypothetical protein
MPQTIPIIICIDVEPDKRCIDPMNRLPWSGFENLYERMAVHRKVLERSSESPVRFCWNLRLDNQIEHTYGSPDWGVQHYRHLIDGIQAIGDEIGFHTHAWRWGPDEGRWIEDHGDESWVEQCVRRSHRVYRECFGRSPRVFTFGDRFMSNRIMALLDELGLVCDVTLEPGHPRVRGLVPSERSTGWIPDYRRVPRRPYQPSIWDYRRPGRLWKRKIWILPQSTGRPQGIIHGLPDPVPKILTMTIGFPFPALQQIMEQNMAVPRPYVAAFVRTDVTQDAFNNEQFELFFAHLADHPLHSQFAFVTPPAALPLLTS